MLFFEEYLLYTVEMLNRQETISAGEETETRGGGVKPFSPPEYPWGLLSRENEFVVTYPLPNEALLPKGAQRPKVTLGETKHKSMGRWVGLALALTISSDLGWGEQWGSWPAPSSPKPKRIIKHQPEPLS